MSDQSKTFEASMNRLEEIVRQLEDGSVPLSNALALFREGTGLVSNCTALLDQAELEIVKLAKGPDGSITEVPFAHEDAE